jgi:peptide/nickel transport system permease protein
MLRFLLRRLAGAVATVFGVSVVVFVLLRALPGDAIEASLGTQAGLLTPAQRSALEQYYGLDEPLPIQFLAWLGSLTQGNLGVSVNSGQSVSSLISASWPVTFELAILVTLIGTPVGVLLGMLAGSRAGGLRDGASQGVALLGLAIPDYVLGTLLVGILATVFNYFPSPGNFIAFTESPSGNLSQVFYPALVLAAGLAATLMRTTRSAYIGAMQADYVRTAIGKGASPARVVFRHVLRNASIPILTMVGIQFGYLLGGTIIVEQVFALPGLGRLLLTAIEQRDYAIAQSTVLVIAVAFVLINLLVDLCYHGLDPRTRTP